MNILSIVVVIKYIFSYQTGILHIILLKEQFTGIHITQHVYYLENNSLAYL